MAEDSKHGSSRKDTDAPSTVPKSSKNDDATALLFRSGGAYIPPAKLRKLQAQITDKSSAAFQRLSWEALKKSLNGGINKANVSNLPNVIRELLQENVIRGRGLLVRSIIKAQSLSPTFAHVYAAMVAVINTKFPQIGDLLLRRLIMTFKRSFRRNQKEACVSSLRFIAHLINQNVVHEVLALEICLLLLLQPTNDSVECAVGFLKECGAKLQEVAPRASHSVFERLRDVLHEASLDMRVQYAVEVLFQIRKDGFKEHQPLLPELNLVEEDDQNTHTLQLDDTYATDDQLDVFKADPNFQENEEKYAAIRDEILGEGDDGSESGSDAGSGDDDASGSEADDNEDAAKDEKAQVILDRTETDLVELRKTIYLTIQSSLDFQECVHKLLKLKLEDNNLGELCAMVLDCCAQLRTYEKFYGLVAQRFCMISKKFVDHYERLFTEQYLTSHRLETIKLRNVARFFAHLLHSDAINWTVLKCIKLTEEDTTSSSRIFLKILFQELAEFLGLSKLHSRFSDPTLAEAVAGIFPRDSPKNSRFAINFLTCIGLGGLTDELREFLRTAFSKQTDEDAGMNEEVNRADGELPTAGSKQKDVELVNVLLAEEQAKRGLQKSTDSDKKSKAKSKNRQRSSSNSSASSASSDSATDSTDSGNELASRSRKKVESSKNDRRKKSRKQSVTRSRSRSRSPSPPPKKDKHKKARKRSATRSPSPSRSSKNDKHKKSRKQSVTRSLSRSPSRSRSGKRSEKHRTKRSRAQSSESEADSEREYKNRHKKSAKPKSKRSSAESSVERSKDRRQKGRTEEKSSTRKDDKSESKKEQRERHHDSNKEKSKRRRSSSVSASRSRSRSRSPSLTPERSYGKRKRYSSSFRSSSSPEPSDDKRMRSAVVQGRVRPRSSTRSRSRSRS